jgi:hypothetical protein
MPTARLNTEDLERLGRKRDWVPMWIWLNLIFRFGVYEWKIIGRLFWVKYSLGCRAAMQCFDIPQTLIDKRGKLDEEIQYINPEDFSRLIDCNDPMGSNLPWNDPRNMTTGAQNARAYASLSVEHIIESADPNESTVAYEMWQQERAKLYRPSLEQLEEIERLHGRDARIVLEKGSRSLDDTLED